MKNRSFTLMVRSGGRAHAMELWSEARFLAERLAARRRSEPSLWARSMRKDWSASEGDESRRRSKERSREIGGEESARERKELRRWSNWEKWEGSLGFWEEEEQGRLAMEFVGGGWRRVSIAGGGGCERKEPDNRKGRRRVVLVNFVFLFFWEIMLRGCTECRTAWHVESTWIDFWVL